MRLRVPQKVIEMWTREVEQAGSLEIGGVLFGEHVGDADFRIIEATKQRRRGKDVSFRRKGSDARRALKRFSKAHDDDHARFNYLGEWHSHPSAPAAPSSVDIATMQNLLAHPQTHANFLVLVIVRLAGERRFEMSANAFLKSSHVLACSIEIEAEDASDV